MRYILTSHGPYAKAALESVEMIVGEQNNVDVLLVTDDTSLDEMVKNIQSLLTEYASEDIVIFCDILGGTPSNASMKNLPGNPNVTVVTGYNLPVLIETFVGDYQTREELTKNLKEVYSQSLNIIEENALDFDETVSLDL